MNPLNIYMIIREHNKALFRWLKRFLNSNFLMWFLILSCCLPVKANTGSGGLITGKVIDIRTGEGLPLVNVIIKETVLGTATDSKGRFELQNIPEGWYELQFNMMGYESTIRKNIQVISKDTINMTIQLSETPIETPELVVTASKRTQNINDSPNSISVMTARELEQKNQIYLDQLLEHVPGVNFMGSQINIRGSSGYSYGVGSRVLFLVDGVPVMSSDKGEINWDFIPASQVERVEIVKSAGSALYGSAALGGIVNVITREAALKPESNIRFSTGFYDDPPWSEWKWTDELRYFNDLDIDHSRRIGKGSVFLSLGRHQSTGYRENGEYLNYNASGKLQMKFAPHSNLLVAGNWESGKNGIGLMWRNQNQALEVEPLAVGDKVHANKFGLNAIHQWAANMSFGLKTRFSYFRSHFEYFMHDNNDYSTAQKIGFEIQGNYIFSKRHSLTFGTEEVLDHISSHPLGEHDIYNLSVYAQDEMRLIPKIILTVGTRFDYTSTDTNMDDHEFSPKLGLVYHITDKITLRGSSGKGFRAPSISERFPDIYAAGLKIIPNLDLKPETAWSHEIGLSTPLSPHLLFNIAGFRNDYWDLIEPVPDATNTVQFINVIRARISGIETILGFSVLNRQITGQVGYTYLNPIDLDLNETLGYRSKHMFNGSITGRYLNMELGFDYRHYDKIDVVKVYPKDPRVVQKVLNVRFSTQFSKWTFSVNANNIFNHMHTQIERTIMPLRHYTAVVKVRL